MTDPRDDSSPEPTPPSFLPSEVGDRLGRLDDEELRRVIDYAQVLLNRRTAPRLEAGSGEEILETEERTGYTKVVKTQPCPEGCSECPHGPYLYYVRTERSPTEADDSLHWVFLGRVRSEEGPQP